MRHARALPWRKSRDPYVIWISEVMLQQTQVTTVLPYFEKFMTLFPSVEALAKAPVEQVLGAWSGLGYYSRARNLHRGANFIVDKYGGEFPRTQEAIREVPGIGPYTAGAILSIAFDLREPLVDGNVQRVFARYLGIQEEIQRTDVQKRFWETAAAWVKDSHSPRVLNQALMELGAMICVKGRPRCEQCPVRNGCEAFRLGIQAELPRKKARREKVDLWWIGLWCESKGKLFLRKNGDGEWWSDLWDFPRVEVESQRQLHAAASQLIDELPVERWDALGFQEHNVTHHRIHVAPYRLELRRRISPNGAEGKWFTPEELAHLPVSSLVRKILGSGAVLK